MGQGGGDQTGPGSWQVLMRQLVLADADTTSLHPLAHPKQTQPRPLAHLPTRCPGNSRPLHFPSLKGRTGFAVGARRCSLSRTGNPGWFSKDRAGGRLQSWGGPDLIYILRQSPGAAWGVDCGCGAGPRGRSEMVPGRGRRAWAVWDSRARFWNWSWAGLPRVPWD